MNAWDAKVKAEILRGVFLERLEGGALIGTLRGVRGTLHTCSMLTSSCSLSKDRIVSGTQLFWLSFQWTCEQSEDVLPLSWNAEASVRTS